MDIYIHVHTYFDSVYLCPHAMSFRNMAGRPGRVSSHIHIYMYICVYVYIYMYLYI